MSWIWTTPGGWLVRSVLGGGLLLLLTWVLIKRTRQPARRQRLGEWGVVAAMVLAISSLAPAWLHVSWLPAMHGSKNESTTWQQANLRSAAKPFEFTPKQQPPSPPLASDNPRKERGASFDRLDGETPFGFDSDLGTNRPQITGDQKRELNEDGTSTEEERESNAAFAHDSSAAIDEDRSENLKPGIEPGAKTQGTGAGSVFLSSMTLEWIGSVLCLVYALVGTFLIGRWLLGYVALRRLLADARPAPMVPRRLFAEMTEKRRRPRLLVSNRLRVPLSCGLWQPTIVLPASLLAANPGQLRWVFAHELTHLQRRDAWSCLLFGLGQGLYFFWPWFWWLRRQVRLSQEYIADAAVLRLAGPAEDYAEFLLSFTAAPAVPLAATGVMGNPSDLFRRVTMLLKNPKRMERRVSWRWTMATAGGLLALAIVASGIGPGASAAADTKKTAAADKATPQDKDKQDKKDDKDNAPKAPQPPGTPFPRGGGFSDFPNNDPDTMAEMLQRTMRQRGMMGGMGMFGGHPRLGVTVSQPNETLVDQLDLPRGQGLVVTQVMPDTPAAKAGLKTNDILLEFNGKAVSSNQGEFVRQVQDVKADGKVDIIVLRKGKKETVKDVALPEEKPAAGFGGFRPGAPGGGGGFPRFGGEGDNNPPFARPGFGAGGGAGMAFGGPNTVMTTVTRTNDRFTTRHQEGSLVITVTGSMTDGKANTNKIHVQDGRESHDYENLDKVPDQYKDKVKNLVDMMEKGNVRIEIKTPEAKPEAKPETKPEAK